MFDLKSSDLETCCETCNGIGRLEHRICWNCRGDGWTPTALGMIILQFVANQWPLIEKLREQYGK